MLPHASSLAWGRLLKFKVDLSIKRAVFGCIELLIQSGPNAARISENATPKPSFFVDLEVGTPVIK